MAEITKITFQEFIRTLSPGDVISVSNGERGILNFLIRKTQTGLINDLNPKLPEGFRIEDPKFWSQFTHSMMVVGQPILTGPRFHDIVMVENFYPHTRQIALSKKIGVGSVVAVSQMKAVDTPNLKLVASLFAINDAKNQKPYPWWKLFYYFGYRWGWQKTFLGKPAMWVFKHGEAGKKDDDWQVCSGSCWEWWMESIPPGTIIDWLSEGDKLPEMWYPARMASDKYYNTRKGVYEIIGESP